MLCRVLHHRVYFHIRDTFLLFCDFDCHASFGRGHCSVLSTHAPTKCATEIVLIAPGNAFLLWSVESGVIKRELFTVFVVGESSGGVGGGGGSSNAIRKVHQKP